MRPSIFGHMFNGFLLLIAMILFLQNYKKLSQESLIEFALLFSIAFGVHAILHHYEEIYYDFNPLANKWKIKDNAILTIKQYQ